MRFICNLLILSTLPQLTRKAQRKKVGYNLANRSLHHHLKPMLSLEHAFGEQGLDKFDQKITNFLKK